MVGCDCERWLAAYHDGELLPDRRRHVEEHLRDCAACAEQLRRLAALSRLLGGSPEPAVPEGMLQRMHRAVRPARERAIIRMCRAASLAAATLLVACGGWLFYARVQEQAPPGPPAAWEMAAVTLETDLTPGDPAETLAFWMASDLSREN